MFVLSESHFSLDHPQLLAWIQRVIMDKFIHSASGSNQEAIDLRIEQTMDLVKAHLMNAVRNEVDEMREKILRLEGTIAQLQSENKFLRANVPSDILVQLQHLQIQHHPGGGQRQQQAALPAPTATSQQPQQQPLAINY